jgi:hypothetical protein
MTQLYRAKAASVVMAIRTRVGVHITANYSGAAR